MNSSSSSARCPICQRALKICRCAVVHGGMALAVLGGHDHDHRDDRRPGEPVGRFEMMLTSSSSRSSTDASSVNFRTPGWPSDPILRKTLLALPAGRPPGSAFPATGMTTARSTSLF